MVVRAGGLSAGCYMNLNRVLFSILPANSRLNNTPTGFTCRTNRRNLRSMTIDTINGSILNSATLHLLSRGGLGCIVPRMRFPANAIRIRLSGRNIPACSVGRGIT